MFFLWQLFLLLIAVAILAVVMGQREIVDVYGEKQIHYTWLPVLAIAIPMIYVAGTRRSIVPDFGDTTAYLLAFRSRRHPSQSCFLRLQKIQKTKDLRFLLQ